MYIVNVASNLCVCVLIIFPAFYSGLSGARALELGLENLVVIWNFVCSLAIALALTITT